MTVTRMNFLQKRGWQALLARPDGWWWLLPALAALVVCGWQWQEAQTRAAATAQRLANLQAQNAPAPRVQRSAQQQKNLEIQAASVAAVVRHINLPLAQILQSLSPPADIKVALLGLDVGDNRGANQRMKLQGEAKSAGDMMNYVAWLDEQKLFASVYLQKHEVVAESKEGHYRFVLEVQWLP